MTKTPRQSKSRTIRVARTHIRGGVCRDPNRCILKLAILDDYRQRGANIGRLAVKGNGVTATTVAADGTKITEKWMVPDKAYKAILHFDKCDALIAAHPESKDAIVAAAGVHPFTFKMLRAGVYARRAFTDKELAAKRKYQKDRIAYFKKNKLPVPTSYLGSSVKGTHYRLDSVLTTASL